MYAMNSRSGSKWGGLCRPSWRRRMRRRILVTLRWSAGLKDTAAAAGEHVRCGNDDPERFQGARRRRALAGDDASRAPPELRPVRLERLPEVDVPTSRASSSAATRLPRPSSFRDGRSARRGSGIPGAAIHRHRARAGRDVQAPGDALRPVSDHRCVYEAIHSKWVGALLLWLIGVPVWLFAAE